MRSTLEERLVGGLVGVEDATLDLGEARGRNLTATGAVGAGFAVDQGLAVLVAHHVAGVVDDVADGAGRGTSDRQLVERGGGRSGELELLDHLDLALDEDVTLGGLLLRLDDHLVVALGVVEPAVGALVEGVSLGVELVVPDLLTVDVHVAGLEHPPLVEGDALGVVLLVLGHAVGVDVGEDAVLHRRPQLEPVDGSHGSVGVGRRGACALDDGRVVGRGVAGVRSVCGRSDADQAGRSDGGSHSGVEQGVPGAHGAPPFIDMCGSARS